jgi:hypothetical protein
MIWTRIEVDLSISGTDANVNRLRRAAPIRYSRCPCGMHCVREVYSDWQRYMHIRTLPMLFTSSRHVYNL